MPLFPSKAWCEEAIRLANDDPDAARAYAGWDSDVGIIVGAEAGKLASDFVVHLEPVEGRFKRFRLLREADELEELEPAYRLSAPYSVWKALIQGALDPVEALVRKSLRVDGDVQPLIERMQYRGIAERVLGRLHTVFPKEN